MRPISGQNSKRQRTLLLLDDDEAFRDLAERLLSDAGFRVLAEASIERGLERAQSEAPDLFLVDLQLGRSSGLEFLRQIRSYPGLTVTPSIVLTGRPRSTEASEALALGADQVLGKPIQPHELLHRVRQALRRRRELHVRLDSPAQVTVEVFGTFHRLGEQESVIVCPVKIAPGAALEVHHERLVSDGIHLPLALAQRSEPSRQYSGQHETRVRWVGLTDEQTDRLQKLIRYWQ